MEACLPRVVSSEEFGLNGPAEAPVQTRAVFAAQPPEPDTASPWITTVLARKCRFFSRFLTVNIKLFG